MYMIEMREHHRINQVEDFDVKLPAFDNSPFSVQIDGVEICRGTYLPGEFFCTYGNCQYFIRYSAPSFDIVQYTIEELLNSIIQDYLDEHDMEGDSE